jgi:hypothetical protein
MTEKFEVIPMLQWIVPPKKGKGRGTISNHEVAGGVEVQKGWNLLWPDGSRGFPAGYGVTPERYKDKEFVKQVGTLAFEKGFRGFNIQK